MSYAHRPRWVTALEFCGVAAFAALWLRLAAQMALATNGAAEIALAAFAALAGYLLADFASGFAHWFCDTFFEETSPVIGRLLIQPFREHHRDPLAMTRHDFLELNGNSCIVLAPVLAIGAWLATGAAANAFLLAFTLALFATNLFHAWAHADSAPRLVRWFQRQRLILCPQRHAAHHSGANDRAFCVTSGWMNAALDRIGFFPLCARALAAIGFPRSKHA